MKSGAHDHPVLADDIISLTIACSTFPEVVVVAFPTAPLARVFHAPF